MLRTSTRALLVTMPGFVPAVLAGQMALHLPDPGAGPIPLHDNLGHLSYRITTTDTLAQAYFNQGLRFYWAFNDGEAGESFREAERHDPDCALCLFGEALALGPNINAPLDPASGVRARRLADRAARMGSADERERAMIDALRTRYDTSRTRAGGDSAWATAVGLLADRYPADQELQTLHAEALMDLSPWRYWTREGEPRPATPMILARIDRVLAANPDHPGACHLLIHVLETHDPGQALPCADRLAALMPGAGHLVHMPGHIYLRLGRYADAIRANERATHTDQQLFEGPNVSRTGSYGLGYYPHNWHFMSFAGALAGRKTTALRAARKVTETVTFGVARRQPWLEAVTPIVYYTLVTFGDWDAILSEPLPPTDLRFTLGMAYYARGVAFAANHRWAESRATLDSVSRIAAGLAPGNDRTAMHIAALALKGEIRLRSGHAAKAVTAFQAATILEDGLPDNEPPLWFYPMRHSLGRAQLAAGELVGAERSYREDLARYPDNGWSLTGLAQTLERQGREAEAAAVRDRLATAWRDADVHPAASRF